MTTRIRLAIVAGTVVAAGAVAAALLLPSLSRSREAAETPGQAERPSGGAERLCTRTMSLSVADPERLVRELKNFGYIGPGGAANQASPSHSLWMLSVDNTGATPLLACPSLGDVDGDGDTTLYAVDGFRDDALHGFESWGCPNLSYGYQLPGEPLTPAQAAELRRVLMAVQPGEELWIIERLEPGVAATADGPDEVPGCGALMARLPGEPKEIPLPLTHTDVQAAIVGYIATVDVTQQYHNPYGETIEAVYVFPLPDSAAVSDFLMTVGERTIRGIIREREQAEQIYAAARAQGHVAALLTQERPNVFTQSVANIEPDKRIDIRIRYFNTLAYDDGWYEFAFPMVVGPRFNPPGSTDGVGAVARGAAGLSGQATEVQYLPPDERSGHDIAVTVELLAGVELEELHSVNHAVEVESGAAGHARVQLDPADRIPNKDFVLRYKVAGERVKTGLVTHRDERGGFFTLMVYPPDELRDLVRAPLEMIFVLDCSGSTSGRPIEQARAAIAHALRKMQPGDTFQIIRFSNSASQLGPAPLPATPENIARGLEYLAELQGEGGTMMIEGIKAAFDFPHDPLRLRTVAFLTDGFIGNELEILAAVHARLGASRIFCFGVGTSVNRYLLDRMAAIGRGAVAYLSLNDDAAEVMDRCFERISHPGLTDIVIDWGGLDVTDVYPERVPDLFVGRPVILTGRFAGREPTTIRVAGRAAGRQRELAIEVDPADASATHPGLAQVWARRKIMDLANRMAAAPDAAAELPQAIRQVALQYGLVSDYTAFVAVDSLTVAAGDHGTTVIVPVPVPEGVRYGTTVRDPALTAGQEQPGL